MLLVVACGAARRATRPDGAAGAAARVPAPRAAEGLYAADEALRDALSRPLQYLGTGRWPGSSRMHACAYRNDRVLVVDVYCSLEETQAFRVEVYSPERGRVRIYAESGGPVSARTRPDYFTFTAESEPPPSAGAGLPPLSLNMSFDELRAYERKRYDAFLPACYGGQELSRTLGGCLGALTAEAPVWAEQNRAFLERANDDWYYLVRELRSLAARHGRDPD